MHCLSQDASNLLRQRAMFGRRFAAQRLFQIVRDISSDENAFAIGH